MPLFHPKILAKELTIQPVPVNILPIITDWADSISSKAIYSQKETALSGQFVQKILVEVLGYSGFSNNHQQWNFTREEPLGKGSVDVALGQFTTDSSKVIVPFELKGAKTKDLDAIMSGRHKSPVQQAWEYAMDAPGAQWVMISNYVEIRLYAVGYGRQNYEVWQLEQLTDPTEYARFIALLHADNLLGTQTKTLLEASEKAEKDITDCLYADYKHLRLNLINTLEKENPTLVAEHVVNLAQTLLDRILFIAFAEDRNLLPDHTLEKVYDHNDPYNPRPVWENFKGLFNAIDKGNAQLNIPAYNGGLFATNTALDDLIVSDELCASFKELGDYDFESEVSVNVLGHIFEQSISDLEAIHEALESGQTLLQSTSKQTATKGKRKQDGVVYTPNDITRFIVEHTLGSYINQAFNALLLNYIKTKKLADGDQDINWKNQKSEQQFWSHWREQLMQIKIVDPACGSGAFLVAAFDYLHDEYSRINEKLIELTGTIDLFDLDKEILTNNLYGIDINAESIEISKLSLWLKTAKRGKALTSLDNNLRHGNSLVFTECETDTIAINGFNWQAAFPEIFAQGGFDVVLGNPPYVRQERISNIKPYLEQHFAVYHGVVDLFAYFYELGLKLLKPNGLLGYISSSTFFKTSSGEGLRQFLSQQSQLEAIIDFGDLQLFEGVTTYPAIIIARQQTANNEHLIAFLNITESSLPEDLTAYFHQHQHTMAQQQLGTQSWRLESSQLAQLRHKLTADHPSLKQAYGSPYRGVLTGFNDAFVIDRATHDQLIADDPRSAELLKPFLEGKDLKKWHSEPRELWLIFTRRGIDIEQYPAVLEYLTQFQQRLTPKSKEWDKQQKALPKNEQEKWSGRKAGPYQWYEIQDTVAYYDQFEQPKINYGHFSPNQLFGFDSQGYFSNDKTYILPNADHFLLGILNSSVSWLLITSMCPFVRGGYYEVRAYYMETLPIPNASNPQKQAIGQLAEQCQLLAEQRYTIEQSVRQRIPDLCPEERDPKLSTKLKNWWQLDFSAFHKEIKRLYKQDIPLGERNDWQHWLAAEADKIQPLSAQLDAHEKQLNQQVYRVFELTPTQISLLENQLKQS
ncbi:MAG: N-6 DNA methylase [Methylophaga sp.]|nr:N-6 DNA methylase [Methylophaga sp.]